MLLMKDVVKIIKKKKSKGVVLSRLLYDIGDIKSTLLDCVIIKHPTTKLYFGSMSYGVAD